MIRDQFFFSDESDVLLSLVASGMFTSNMPVMSCNVCSSYYIDGVVCWLSFDLCVSVELARIFRLIIEPGMDCL